VKEDGNNPTIHASDENVEMQFQMLFERTIVAGHFFKTLLFDTYRTEVPKTSENMKLEFSELELPNSININVDDHITHQGESYILSVDRLLKYGVAVRKRGLFGESKELKSLLKKWSKEIDVLRSHLMHLEEYIVAGKGRNKDKFFGNVLGLVSAPPGSSVTFNNSSFNGQKIDFEHFISARLPFIALFSEITSTYFSLRKGGLFKENLLGTAPFESDDAND